MSIAITSGRFLPAASVWRFSQYSGNPRKELLTVTFGYSSSKAAMTWLYRSARTSLPQNARSRVTSSSGSNVGAAFGAAVLPLPPAHPAKTNAAPAAKAIAVMVRFLLNILVLSFERPRSSCSAGRSLSVWRWVGAVPGAMGKRFPVTVLRDEPNYKNYLEIAFPS